jgi:hypothetical protein
MIKLATRVDEHNNLPKKGEDGSNMRTWPSLSRIMTSLIMMKEISSVRIVF